MKFKYKSAEEISKMTPEQQDIYAEQKRQHEADERKNEIISMMKKLLGLDKNADGTENKDEVTTEMVAAKIVSLGISKAEFEEVKETLNQIKESSAAPSNNASASANALAKEIKANKDALKAALRDQTGSKEVSLKALTNVASVQNNNDYLRLPGIGQLIRIARSFYDKCTKIPVSKGTHQGTVTYMDWDEDTTAKAAAMIAEGGTFPESTAKFKMYTMPLRKVGDTLPVTEEFFEDEAAAAAELDLFLSANVKSKVDNQLINGDGTGNNLTGLKASIPAFAAVASGITDANVYDLIKKVTSAIVTPAGNKYDVNMAVMNRNTIDLLVLKKDANHNYQFPMGHPIYDLIVEDNNVADNELYVGDGRFARIYEMGDVVLSRGTKGDQFVEDTVTLKARQRLLFLIKNADKSGFRKVTDVTAALATLAS